MSFLDKIKARLPKRGEREKENEVEDQQEPTEKRHIEGERTMPNLRRNKSAEGRLTHYIVISMVVVIGAAFLFKYYTIYHDERREREEAAAPARDTRKTGNSSVSPFSPGEGAPPPPPNLNPAPAASVQRPSTAPPAPMAQPRQYGPDGKPILTPEEQLKLDRLNAPVAFKRDAATGAGAPRQNYAMGSAGPAPQGNSGALGSALVATSTPTARAAMLPNRDFIIPKGTMIDCTMETAIESSLAGMVKCVQTYDVYSDSGRVVLLERGTVFTGEYRAEMRPGQANLFILWAEARTPKGVVVELASPATDSLGRAGVSGFLDKHFMERFGAAMMFTAIQTVSGVLQNRAQGQNNTVYTGGSGNSGSEMNQMISDLVKPGMQIQNSITKNQGEHVNIFVARLLDFRGVYELRNSH